MSDSNKSGKSCVLTPEGQEKVDKALRRIEQEIKNGEDLGQRFADFRSLSNKKIGNFNGFFRNDRIPKYNWAEIVRYIEFFQEDNNINSNGNNPLNKDKLPKILDKKEPVVKSILEELFEALGEELKEEDYTNPNSSQTQTEESLSNPESSLIASSHENLEINRSMLTDSDKQYLVEQIKKYYADRENSLRTIFLMNPKIFGTNFYGWMQGESFNIRISSLVHELILRTKLDDFIRIVREDYPDFAIRL